jgi:hypothetical protein
MDRIIAACLFYGLSMLSGVSARASDQPASDSGVLVSSSARMPEGDDHAAVAPIPPDSDTSLQNASGDAGDKLETSADDIVIKAANAVIFQMTANLKLTPDQTGAVRPVIMDNIVKTRKLQQRLKDGAVDGKTMVRQRRELTEDEDRRLLPILTPGQLKTWMDIQNQYDS